MVHLQKSSKKSKKDEVSGVIPSISYSSPFLRFPTIMKYATFHTVERQRNTERESQQRLTVMPSQQCHTAWTSLHPQDDEDEPSENDEGEAEDSEAAAGKKENDTEDEEKEEEVR